MSKRKKYIFRWNDSGIEVEPSRADSKELVWEFAVRCLRRAGDKRPNDIVRKELEELGKVVEVQP